MNNRYLTIDIGGTDIKMAIYDNTGYQIVETVRIKTPSGDNITQKIINEINSQEILKNFDGIAISSAGVIDSHEGRVIFSGPTIPNYAGVKLKEVFENEYNVKCVVENDVNAALLGEYWKGAAQKSSSSFMLTVGTGIGGAFMLNQKLFTGHGFSAGEIGYLNINGEHFQQVASTTTLVNNIEEKLGLSNTLDGRKIFEMIRRNDIMAIEALDHLIYNLCLGISDILYLFNPEILILGGGIMEESELIEPIINKHLKEILISERFIPQKIAFANCGNNAGMLGALYRLIHE